MGKAGDLTRPSQGALALCPAPRPRPSNPPTRALKRQRAPRRPSGAAQSPRHLAAPRPPGRSSGPHSPAGGGARGVRAHPAKGSYLSASVGPTKLALLLGLRGWGGSHGRGSRLPPPRAPRPYGGPELGRRDQGTGAARAGGGGSRGARWGGAGASAGPRPEGTWERLSRRTKAAGEGSEPPGPGPELELVLDTSSGRWRGNPSELGRGLSLSPHVPGRGRARPPRRRMGAWHPQEPAGPVRSKVPWSPGPWCPFVPWESRGAEEASGSPAGSRGPGPYAPPSHSHPTVGPGRSRGCAGLAGFSARRVGGRYSAAN